MVNMDNLILGLTLVIFGMAITFMVLVILSAVIHYFGKFIKRGEDKKNKKLEEKLNLTETQTKDELETSNDELTAMIAAAYFHISKDAVSLINLYSNKDNWKLLTRREQMEML